MTVTTLRHFPLLGWRLSVGYLEQMSMSAVPANRRCFAKAVASGQEQLAPTHLPTHDNRTSTVFRSRSSTQRSLEAARVGASRRLTATGHEVDLMTTIRHAAVAPGPAP